MEVPTFEIPEPKPGSILAKMGQEQLDKLVEEHLDQVFKMEEFCPMLKDSHIEVAKVKKRAFLSIILGDNEYEGPSLKDAHHSFKINEDDFQVYYEAFCAKMR